MFDRAEGRTVTQAAIDHRVNGQEVRHGARKETSVWERGSEEQSGGGDEEDVVDGGGDSTRSRRLKSNTEHSER